MLRLKKRGMLRSLERELDAAQETIEETDETLEGFKAGRKPGTDYQLGVSVEEIAEFFAQNKRFRQMAKWAGRMAATGRAKARRRRSRGSSEAFDITTGGIAEIADALPTEMLGLVDSELEVLFDKSVCEESLQIEKRRGNEPEERGPVVVCLDESGSMHYDGHRRDAWAKAAAFAMFQRCAEERRPFCLVRFSDTVRVHSYVKPQNANWADVQKWLGRNMGGGTDIDNAISCAESFIKEQQGFKKADVMLITDGQAGGWLPRVARMKKNGVSTYGIKIGGKWRPAETEYLEEHSSVTDSALRSGDLDGKVEKVLSKMTDGLGV